MSANAPTLETEHLLLRPLSHGDLHSLTEIAADRRIADTTISVPHPFTPQHGKEWIERAQQDWKDAAGVHFAISPLAEPARFLGYIAVKSIDPEHQEAELSFWIAASEAGKGYTSEAAFAVVHFAFHRLPINRICAYHMVRNPSSGRVLAKIGMTQEGRLRQRVRKWGVFEDVLVWSRLRAD